jgi:hypothetical protein
MALARYEGVAQDAAGNVIPNATVEVRRDAPGRPVVPLFSDRNGTVPIGNPIKTDPLGKFSFHAPGGVYYVRVFTGPSQAPFQEYVRRYQALGTAAERDVEDLARVLESGTAGFSTIEELQAFVPSTAEGVLGKVLRGAGAGFYHYDDTQEEGEKWIKDRPLFDTFARLTVVDGTANAIEAELEDGIDDASVKLMALIPEETNTGPVTLNGLPLKDVSGAALIAGQLVAGRSYNLTDEGDHYRLRQETDVTGVPSEIAAVAALALAQILPAKDETLEALDDTIEARDAAVLAKTASELAASVAAVTGPKYADEATGRAAVANGATFLVQGSGRVGAIEYKRIDSTTSQEIARWPSLKAIDDLGASAPTIEGWAELTVDASGRPTWGKDRSGNEWEARAGAMVRLAPRMTVDPDGLHSLAASLKVTTSFVPPASMGLPVLAPALRDWRELTVDASGRPVFGVTNDGKRWRAESGFLVEEQSSGALPGAQEFDFDATSFSHLLDAADAETGNVDLLVLIVGQSWAGGYSHDDGDATVTSTAQHAGRALMLSAGVEPNGTPSTSYVDLKEAERGTSSYESPASGMADVIMQGLQSRFGRKPRIIFAISANGGKLYHELKRGSSDYRETLRMVQEAIAISGAQGRRVIVPCIALMHGENDASSNTPRSVYSRDLDQWQEHYEEDIRRLTGQTAPVRFYLSQTSYRAAVSVGNPRTTALAQLDAMKRNPMIRVAGPMYQSPGDDGGGHLKAVGYRMAGAVVGQAILDDYFGVNAEPLHVLEAWWVSSTVARLKYTKPIALETGDTLVKVSTLGNGRGVDFLDGSGSPPTVSSIAIASGTTDTLEVTLTAAPAGKRPRFFVACRSTPPSGGTGYSGATYGNRSAIRSATAFFTDSLASRTLYHWACQEEIALPPIA